MYYFASDVHLGLESAACSQERERLFVRWLDEVSADARGIILAGDIFDFWFEWKRVIPKGFSRVLGKLSELTDRDIEIHFFAGNHDMWAYDYLHTECGVTLHMKPEVFELYDKKIFIAHGDNMYVKRAPVMERFMQSCFHSGFWRWVFGSVLSPNAVMRFGQWWSARSRKARDVAHSFGNEEEYLVRYAREYLRAVNVDYFVFGHIHCAADYDLGEGRRAIFLGEWIENPAYAVLSPDGRMELKLYDPQ